jgi:hypothetical protein
LDNSGSWRVIESRSGLETVRRFNLLIALAALALPPAAHAHEVPSDVTVRMLVRPDGDRVRLLVRAPLEAMQDIVFPTLGPGYLDVPRAAPQLRDAAQVWLLDNLDLYEGGRRLPLAIVAVRASIPSDRSFAEYDTALAHFTAAPLPAGIDLPWQQALLDVELEAPIESEASLFSCVRAPSASAGASSTPCVSSERTVSSASSRSKATRASSRSIRAGINRCCGFSHRVSRTSSTVPITCCSCSASSCRFGVSCARSRGSSRRSRPATR